MIMCDCKSYNIEVGTVPEVIVEVPKHFCGDSRQTVCIDGCIVDHVKALWDANIFTLGSCCGHNGVARRSVIVEEGHKHDALSLLNERGADMEVGSWSINYIGGENE